MRVVNGDRNRAAAIVAAIARIGLHRLRLLPQTVDGVARLVAQGIRPRQGVAGVVEGRRRGLLQEAQRLGTVPVAVTVSDGVPVREA